MTASGSRPRIAVDAMGGDFGPRVVVPGVVDALRADAGCEVVLYGEEASVRAALAEADAADLPLTVVDCRQDIAMGEPPATAVRSKPDSPIVRAMRDHREGAVNAVVSAGSTGAMVAASLLILGRLEAADRPTIATFIPTATGETLLVDGGANTQCTPEMLIAFARMGAVYVRALRGTEQPRVGLLNIGEEPGKGSELTVATHALLRETELNFVGNVEGNDVLVGACDVLVTDGFTGNILLKLAEGIAQFFRALGASGRLGGHEMQALGVLGAVLQQRFSYENYGGAPLLGVAGTSIICHGRSSERAFRNAVLVAEQQVRADVTGQLSRALAQAAS